MTRGGRGHGGIRSSEPPVRSVLLPARQGSTRAPPGYGSAAKPTATHSTVPPSAYACTTRWPASVITHRLASRPAPPRPAPRRTSCNRATVPARSRSVVRSIESDEQAGPGKAKRWSPPRPSQVSCFYCTTVCVHRTCIVQQ